MYYLTDEHCVTRSILTVFTACAFIFDRVDPVCWTVSPSLGASKKKTGFSMYSIMSTYISSRKREVEQSSTMIDIARIEFSMISSYYSAEMVLIY